MSRPLDYAPRPSARWRWGVRFKRWWPAGVMLVAAVLAIGYGPRVWRRWRLLRLQEACLRAELPGDRPMTQGDDTASRALVAAWPAQYQPNRYGYAAWVDSRWAAMARELGSLPRPSAVAGDGVATMFLHERFTPDGRRRLVVAEGMSWRPAWVTVIEPAGWLGGGPRVLWRGLPDRDLESNQALDRAWNVPGSSRVGAGAADPGNRSRFTVPFAVHGVSGTWEFLLGNDDQITFRLLDPAGFKARAEAAGTIERNGAARNAPTTRAGTLSPWTEKGTGVIRKDQSGQPKMSAPPLRQHR